MRPRFEPREILLATVNFPEQQPKKRPVLVISKFSAVGHRFRSRHFICMPITSNKNVDPLSMIKINDDDVEGKALPKQSQIVYNHIFTLLKNRTDKRLGSVTLAFYQTVLDAARRSVF